MKDDLCAAALSWAYAEVPVDQPRALVHAPDAAAHLATRVDPAPVVGDPQRQAVRAAVERELAVGRARVADDVPGRRGR